MLFTKTKKHQVNVFGTFEMIQKIEGWQICTTFPKKHKALRLNVLTSIFWIIFKCKLIFLALK